ncbi:hypothetical protein FHG87_021026, partial [Trinorchestia longiramus]
RTVTPSRRLPYLNLDLLTVQLPAAALVPLVAVARGAVARGAVPRVAVPLVAVPRGAVARGADSAPSHGSNVTQTWIQRNIPSFINEDVWPARSSDLNPLNFSIWSILKARVLAIPHTSLESLKAKLQKEWETISQEEIRAACDAFLNRLKAVVHNKANVRQRVVKGGYIE